MACGRPFPRVRGAVSRAVRVRWTTSAPALPYTGRRACATVVQLCLPPRQPAVG